MINKYTVVELHYQPPLFLLKTANHSISLKLPRPSDYFSADTLKWYFDILPGFPFSTNLEIGAVHEKSILEWARESVSCITNAMEQQMGTPPDQDVELHFYSDTPEIFAWPLEALEATNENSTNIKVLRVIDTFSPVSTNPISTPDSLNILLVTARPFPDDIEFTTISKTLIECVSAGQLPISFTLLRPPTKQYLQAHLRLNRQHYQMLHLDVHGEQTGLEENSSRLWLEDDFGNPEALSARELAEIVSQTSIHSIVLNACESGQFSNSSSLSNASFATELIYHGVSHVVAMSYLLYVDDAKRFFSHFYQSLTSHGDISKAIHDARNRSNHESLPQGRIKLDWLVPTHYQNINALEERSYFKSDTRAHALPKAEFPGPEVIGRDNALSKLERHFFYQKSAPVLIYGEFGVGKTSLVKAFKYWLEQTKSKYQKIHYFSLKDTPFDSAINNILNTRNSDTWAHKLNTLSDRSQSGSELWIIEDIHLLCPQITDANRLSNAAQLTALLSAANDTSVDCLLTSHDQCEWLTDKAIELNVFPLKRLESKSVWQLITQRDGSVITEQKARDISTLCCNNPMMLRLQAEFDCNEDTALDKLLQHPQVAEFIVSVKNLLPLLSPNQKAFLCLTGLFRERIDIQVIQALLRDSKILLEEGELKSLLLSLTSLGAMVKDRGQAWSVHPLLTIYLRNFIRQDPSFNVDYWRHKFVIVHRDMLGDLDVQDRKQMALAYKFWIANFTLAYQYGKDLQVTHGFAQLSLYMGIANQHCRDLHKAKLFLENALHGYTLLEDEHNVSIVLHQLGIYHLDVSENKQADECFKKSIKIKKALNNKDGLRPSYYQLGWVQYLNKEYSEAKSCYLASLRLSRNNPLHQAKTYGALSRLYRNIGDASKAKYCITTAYDINQRIKNFDGLANNAYELGNLNLYAGQFSDSRSFYERSLAHYTQLQNPLGQAKVLTQLGSLHWRMGNIGQVEEMYLKSIKLKQVTQDREGLVTAYQQLANFKEFHDDSLAALKWLRTAENIQLQMNDTAGLALTYYQLGTLQGSQLTHEQQLAYLQYSLTECTNESDLDGIARATLAIAKRFYLNDNFSEATMWFKKIEGANTTPSSATVEAAYYLGIIEHKSGNIYEAIEKYKKAASYIQVKVSDHAKASNFYHLGIAQMQLEMFGESLCALKKALGLFQLIDDKEGEASAYFHIGQAHQQLGKLNLAKTAYLKAKTLCEQLDDTQGVEFCLEKLDSLIND